MGIQNKYYAAKRILLSALFVSSFPISAYAQGPTTFSGGNELITLSATAPYINWTDSGTQKFMIQYYSGYLRVYNWTTTSYTWRWDNDGKIYYSYAMQYTSDERLKTDIKDLDGSALDKLSQIRGVSFVWKADAERGDLEPTLGVIAQDVEKVYPDLVETDDEGYKSVNYDGLVAPLIEGVKELWVHVQEIQTQIAALFDRDDELQAQIDALRTEIEALKAQNAKN